MAKCIECGGYTKYNGGLCYSCFGKKDGVLVKEPTKEKNNSLVKEKNVKQKKNDSLNANVKKENPWVSGVIKGRIAETIIEELFRSLDFQVFSYGMENSIPGIKDLLKGVKDDVARNIRQMPDFVIFKDNRAHFIEVKFRASGKLILNDIEKYGPYPYENALIVLVTKKHIKCISFSELKEGKEIKEDNNFMLGSRKEFETDNKKIIEYCKYAVKFFETV